jgi:hypothetical protein
MGNLSKIAASRLDLSFYCTSASLFNCAGKEDRLKLLGGCILGGTTSNLILVLRHGLLATHLPDRKCFAESASHWF